MTEDFSWRWPAAALGLLVALGLWGLESRRMNTPPDDLWFQAKVIDSRGVVLVKFGAEWCGPCQMMHKELERLQVLRGGAVTVLEIDIDEKPELARHYGVRGIPDTVLFMDGTYRARLVGSRSAEDLDDWVAPYLARR